MLYIYIYLSFLLEDLEDFVPSECFVPQNHIRDPSCGDEGLWDLVKFGVIMCHPFGGQGTIVLSSLGHRSLVPCWLCIHIYVYNYIANVSPLIFSLQNGWARAYKVKPFHNYRMVRPTRPMFFKGYANVYMYMFIHINIHQWLVHNRVSDMRLLTSTRN